MAEPIPFGEVYDGDTVYRKSPDGSRSGDRLFGINAPEIKSRGAGEVVTEAGAEEARARLTELLAENPNARREVVDTDVYGREVVRYFGDDGSDLNERMVREGYASAYDARNSDSPYAFAQVDFLQDLRNGAAELPAAEFRLMEENMPQRGIGKEIAIGFRRGVDQTKGMLNFGLSQMMDELGFHDAAKDLANNAQDAFQDSAKSLPTVGSWKEANESAKYATWVAGLFGEQAPQLAFDLGVGLLTRGGASAASMAAKKAGKDILASAAAKRMSFNAGAAASMYTQQVGAVAQELKANGIHDPRTALLYALPATGLDFVSMRSLVSTAGRLYQGGKIATANSIIAGMAKNTAWEGTTEALQEVIAKTAVASKATGYDIFSEENIDDYIEALAAGLAVGGTFSAAGHAPAAARALMSKQNQQILDYSESREEAGADGVMVETYAPDGARMAEATSRENAENVARRHREALGEGAESTIKSAEEELQERQAAGGEMSSNGDHVRETPQQVAGDVKAVKRGAKKVALVTPESLQELDAELAGTDVIQTEDDRVFVTAKPEETQRVTSLLDSHGVAYRKESIPQDAPGGYVQQMQQTYIKERARVAQKLDAKQVPFAEKTSPIETNPELAEKLNAVGLVVVRDKKGILRLRSKGKVISDPVLEKSNLLRELERKANLLKDVGSDKQAQGMMVDYLVELVKARELLSKERRARALEMLETDVLDRETVRALLTQEDTADLAGVEPDRRPAEVGEGYLERRMRGDEVSSNAALRDDYSGVDSVEETATENIDEGEALDAAIDRGIVRAINNYNRRMAVGMRLKDWQERGFASKGDAAAFKDKWRNNQESVYLQNPKEAHAVFESEDGRVVEVYVPEAVAALNREYGLQSTSDRNKAQRDMDAFSAIVGRMAERGFRLTNDPGKIHVAPVNADTHTAGNAAQKARATAVAWDVEGTEPFAGEQSQMQEEGTAAWRQDGVFDKPQPGKERKTSQTGEQATPIKITEPSAIGKLIPLASRRFLKELVRDTGITSAIEIEFKPLGNKFGTVVFKDATVQGARETYTRAVITLNSDRFVGHDGRPKLSEDQVNVVLAHELGHVFVAETMHLMDAKALDMLKEAYKKQVALLSKNHPYKASKAAGFDEWLADQFSAYARGRGKVHPKSQAFVKKVMAALGKLIDKLGEYMFGVERLSGTETGIEFMDSMVRVGVQGSAPLKGDRFAEFTSKFYIETRDGDKVRKAGEYRAEVAGYKSKKPLPDRDLTAGQAMDSASSVGRAFYSNLHSSLTHPRDTLGKLLGGAKTLASGAFFLRTADHELRAMGGAGRKIADKYKGMFDGIAADLHVWTTRADDLLKKVPKADLEAFARGNREAPPAVRKFFQDMYAYGKEHIKDLGRINKDFVPRYFDKEAVESRRGEFVQELMAQAEEAGTPISRSAAEDITTRIIRGDSLAEVYLEDKHTLSGPSFQNKKNRSLEYLNDTAMRQQGFLSSDPSTVMAAYINHMVRRVNYEKQFAGYNTLGDESEVRSKRSAQEVASRLLASAIRHHKLFVKDAKAPSGWRILTDTQKEEIIGNPTDKNFMRRAMPLLDQLAARGILMKPKMWNSPLAWAYYDQNKHLRRYGAMLGDGDKRRLLTIADAMSGRLGADAIPYKWRRMQSNIMAYENLTVMGLAVFAQFADMAGMVFRNRDFAGALDALNEIRKLLLTQEGKERRKLFNDLGFAERQLSMQAILEVQGLQFQTDGARKVNEFLFKWNGVQAVTNFTRVLTAAVGERFLIRNAAAAKNGDARAARYLKELGLTPDAAAYVKSAEYRPYSYYVNAGDVGTKASEASKKSEAIHKALFKFVDSAVVRPNATQRPVWASDPRFALIWHLKSFMYAYGHTIVKGLFHEMGARWSENKGKPLANRIGDAAVPLATYLAPVFMLSVLGLETREKVQYELWGADDPTSKLDWDAYTVEILKRGGVMGAGEMGYSFVEATGRGQSGVARLMGPTVSHLEVLLQGDFPKSAARSTPIINQIPPLRDWYKAMLGAE